MLVLFSAPPPAFVFSLLLFPMCWLCQWTCCSFSICPHKPRSICAGWVPFKPVTKKQEPMSLSMPAWKNTASGAPLTHVPGEVSSSQSKAVIKWLSLEFWLKVTGNFQISTKRHDSNPLMPQVNNGYQPGFSALAAVVHELGWHQNYLHCPLQIHIPGPYYRLMEHD